MDDAGIKFLIIGLSISLVICFIGVQELYKERTEKQKCMKIYKEHCLRKHNDLDKIKTCFGFAQSYCELKWESICD